MPLRSGRCLRSLLPYKGACGRAGAGGGGGGRGGGRSPWRRSLSRRGRRAVQSARTHRAPQPPGDLSAPPAPRLASRQSQHRAAIHLGDLVKINKPAKIHWRAMHHRPGGLLRGSLQPRLQPCSVGAGEAGCWCWGKAAAARVVPDPLEQPPGGDPAPSPHCHPLLSPPSPRGGGRGRPTAAESIGTHFPVYLREGEEGRETLLSVAIVNPNNNNKEKSLQLGAG